MKEYIYEDQAFKGFEITEANKTQLQEGVLAIVKGPSFFADGYSRNGRFYPKKLWENALKNPNTNLAIQRGIMFGCIGHPKDYTLDELLESGKVSHKVSSIVLDKNGDGICEFTILDTPAGRILNAVLRSGSEMYVSTRAFGGFSSESKNKDGKKYKVLDINNFEIESIDFVIQPGFLETQPKLIESLSEDFKELKENDEKHHIECIDGICGLKIQPQNEGVRDNDQKGEIDGKNELNEINEETPMFNREMVDKLPKEDIITMLENIINENRIISSNAKLDESDEIMVSSKLMMNYVSYVELLTKMVRYNVEFEKYYDKLIEFLDKDSKLSTNDMASLDTICDEILKEKDVDESIIKICERIKELAVKINSDGEDDGEKKDKEGKESKDKPEKGKDKEDTSPEIKVPESFVDFVLSMKEIQTETVVEVVDEEKIRELKNQLLQMKEATKFLTKKLEEEMDKDPETIIETKTKIEYKIPDDMHESIQKKNEEYDILLEQIKENEKDAKSMQEKINSSDKELNTMTELYDEIEKELIELKESIVEKEETDKSLFREILEDKQVEYDTISESFKQMEANYESVKAERDSMKNKNETLKANMFSSKAKYYASEYKMDVHDVKILMETHSDEKDLVNALSKQEKLNRRAIPKSIEVPEYNPRSSLRDSKSKFLENLTK